MDELLVEFSGELSGHIHVACIPPSLFLSIQHLHSKKENIIFVLMQLIQSVSLDSKTIIESTSFK